MRFKRKEGVKPLCELPDGCPIEELAADSFITSAAKEYLQAKALQRATGVQRFLEDYYTRYNLFDEPSVVLDLECIFAKTLKASSNG